MRRPAARRPTAPPPPDEEEAVALRRLRAAEEPLDVRLRYREPSVELEVRNPVHRTSYRVFLPNYPSRDAGLCTCTDFARRGLGTCKHLEAAWDWLAHRPQLPDAPTRPGTFTSIEALWKGIDRRTAELARLPPHDIREVERAGLALIDPERSEEGEEEVGRGAGGNARPTRTSRAHP
jgi:hypothetical protein